MASLRMPPPYHVTVHPVEEVSLIGTADLAYWQRMMSDYLLTPRASGGKAEIIVSAASARFMGKRFRELSFSLFVTHEKRSDFGEGAFMLYAFNSSRLFAWVERTFFHTPYYFGHLAVGARGTAEVRLTQGGVTLLNARLASPTRTRVREAEEGWEGPIHLGKRGGGDPRRLFFARLWGNTRVYEFDSATDVFDGQGGAADLPFRWLRESGFTPREWHIREAATHSKSKTVLLDGQE